VELPGETVEEEGREGAGWIKTKQRDIFLKRSSRNKLPKRNRCR
jgi:hypothetical protein